MSEESRETLTDLIGRGGEPPPDARIAQPSDERAFLAEAVWLVLAIHLRGLTHTGVIDDRSTARIAGALETLAGFQPSTNSFRETQQALEERIDSILPEELRGATTLGLAHEEWSNTALRMVARSAIHALADEVVRVQAAMLAAAELHTVTLMQGFHSGRPIQPVTFGHFLGGAIDPVATGLTRLLDALDGVNRSPLGAGSMSGEAVGSERAETARWLGFRGTIHNTFDAVSNVEDFVAAVEAVATVAAPLARLLDELALMVRTDPSSLVFDEDWMRQPDHHLPGFSAADRLPGLARELQSVMSRSKALVGQLRRLPYGPLGASTDWIAIELHALLVNAGEGLRAAEALFRSAMSVNRAYLANRAGRDYTTSSDLATFLISEEQLPPSAARNIAGLTLRRLREENVEISAITPEHVDMAAMMVIGRELKVEVETLGRWFAPRRFLERRLVEGSPAPAKTRDWIAQERERNEQVAEGISSRHLQFREAEGGMHAWIADCASDDEQR